MTLFSSAAPTLTTIVNAGIHPLVIATAAFICSVAAVTPLSLAAISIYQAAVYQIRSGTAV
jgi:hypothetical protein